MKEVLCENSKQIIVSHFWIKWSRHPNQNGLILDKKTTQTKARYKKYGRGQPVVSEIGLVQKGKRTI